MPTCSLPKILPRQLRAVTILKLGSVHARHKKLLLYPYAAVCWFQRGPPTSSHVIGAYAEEYETKEKAPMPWSDDVGARRVTQLAILPARLEPADEVRLRFRLLDCNYSNRGSRGTGKVHSECLPEESETQPSAIMSPCRIFPASCYERYS